MTYILGSRCIDGVVMISDRKFTMDDGTGYIFDDKLFNIKSSGIIIGFSGSRGAFELFQARMQEYMSDYAEKEGNTNIDDIRVDRVLLKVSDITHDLYNKFRLSGSHFDILVGTSPVILRKNRLSDSSFLKYYYEDGKLETINKYRAIGNGAPFGSIYLKQNWNPNMAMKQVAELGYFIIKYIERYHLDLPVGVNTDRPQIWFIPDKEVAHSADSELLDEYEEKTRKRLERIEENKLHKLF
jgi:20S proteasome alpha/beta subunit